MVVLNRIGFTENWENNGSGIMKKTNDNHLTKPELFGLIKSLDLKIAELGKIRENNIKIYKNESEDIEKKESAYRIVEFCIKKIDSFKSMKKELFDLTKSPVLK